MVMDWEGDMVRYYKPIPGAGKYLTRFLTLVFFSAAFFASPVLQAEKSPEIARYTLQREKTPEFFSSTLQTGKPPVIEITEQSGA